MCNGTGAYPGMRQGGWTRPRGVPAFDGGQQSFQPQSFQPQSFQAPQVEPQPFSTRPMALPSESFFKPSAPQPMMAESFFAPPPPKPMLAQESLFTPPAAPSSAMPFSAKPNRDSGIVVVEDSRPNSTPMGGPLLGAAPPPTQPPTFTPKGITLGAGADPYAAYRGAETGDVANLWTRPTPVPNPPPPPVGNPNPPPPTGYRPPPPPTGNPSNPGNPNNPGNPGNPPPNNPGNPSNPNTGYGGVPGRAPPPNTPFQPGQVGWEFDTGGRGWIPQFDANTMSYWGDIRGGNPYASWINQINQNDFINSIGQLSGMSMDQWRGRFGG
jgi:hypothetical protein